MFNNKGSTLIESLLAFEIFISVLIVLITSLTTIYNHELRLKENYTKILEKEEVLLEKEDLNTSYAIQKNYRLPEQYLTKERKLFLQYHKEHIFLDSLLFLKKKVK